MKLFFSLKVFYLLLCIEMIALEVLKGDPSDFFFMSGRGLQTLYVCFTSFNSDRLAASLISSFLDPLIRHLITYFGAYMIFFCFF